MRCLEDTGSHCQEGTPLSCPPSPCLSSPADQHAGMDKHSSPAAAQPSALIPSPEDPVSCPTGEPAHVPFSLPRSPAQSFPLEWALELALCSLVEPKDKKGMAQLSPGPCPLHCFGLSSSPLLAVHGQHHAGVLQLHLHPPGDELQGVPAQHRQGFRGLPWAWRRTERVTGKTCPNPHTQE